MAFQGNPVVQVEDGSPPPSRPYVCARMLSIASWTTYALFYVPIIALTSGLRGITSNEPFDFHSPYIDWVSGILVLREDAVLFVNVFSSRKRALPDWLIPVPPVACPPKMMNVA